MAERRWTEAQTRAIDHKGGNLLVSAAAGSGKTATLTERIIRLLTADGSEADVRRMLVVTFTKAAAGELRDRIRASLASKLRDDKANKRIAKQLTLLPTADICTIHSFCLGILRSHYTEAGLPPDFTVAEEGAMNVLKAQLMRDTVSEYYADAEASGSASLADVLGGAKSDDALDAVLADFARSLEAHGYGADKLNEYADMLERSADEGFLSSEHGEKLRESLTRRLDHYIKIFVSSLGALTENDALIKNYLPAARDCLDFAERLRSSLEKGDYDGCRTLIADRKPLRLGAVKAENQTEASLLFKDARETFTKEISGVGKQYFAVSEEEAAMQMRRTAAVCRDAAPVVGRYFDAYAKAKRDRGVVDFGDLENLACRLLYDENGGYSRTADEISAKYDYVFIDEYQDTNEVQDRIFKAVSRVSGRFLVGDIKQSIYRFRGAEPEVFASYRRKWNGTDEADGESVFMSENFRCDESVVSFTNLVSRYMFADGSVPFSGEDELIHAKSEDAPGECPVEVRLIDTDFDDEDGEYTGVNCEAEYVADRIAGMIGKEKTEGGRLIRGGDIAILLRSPSSSAEDYTAALARRGIRTENSAKADFFSLPEILLAVSVMNAVDNPMRDVYLAGAMMSPVFRFTADDLVKVRMAAGDSPLWQAVRSYSGDDALAAKCTAFAERLTKLRRECAGLTADGALRLIYDETGLPEYDYGTATARANLMTLYDMAIRIEGGVFKGLYGFVSHISELIEAGGSEVNTGEGSDPDAVHILSIHHSKGLEYPVCFISEASHKFNLTDSRSNLIFDPRFGPAMRLPDASGLLRIDTPVRQAAALKITDDTVEEEMRDLYVAMTRARCRLTVTAKMKSPEEKYAAIKNAARFADAHTVLGTRSYIEWVLGAIAKEPTEPEYVSLSYVKPHEADEMTWHDLPTLETDGERTSYTELIKERLSFEYKDAHISLIPSKLTVSKLTPDILDPEEVISDVITPDAHAAPDEVTDEHTDAVPVPKFLSGNAGYTPAEAGIATHLFMQFCDYSRLAEVGADGELARLVSEKFITQAIAERVNRREIAMFIGSPLFDRIKNAREVRREFRFNAALPASQFTKDEALARAFDESKADVIVQGVIDCVIVDHDGNLVLIDYKTDRFPKGTDREAAKAALALRHKNQLTYYRKICEMMYGRKVDETCVYSLWLGEEVPITD